MTGYHNGRCRLDDNDDDYLRDADVTLAERLKRAGYSTALVGKWGLSWDTEPGSWPQAQGFDTFFGYRDQVHAHNFYPEYLLDGTDSLRTRNVVPKPRGMGSGVATVRLDYVPDLIRTRAFDFVRRSAEQRKPFFLFWATNLPHIHNEASREAPDGGYEIPSLGSYASRSWPLQKELRGTSTAASTLILATCDAARFPADSAEHRGGFCRIMGQPFYAAPMTAPRYRRTVVQWHAAVSWFQGRSVRRRASRSGYHCWPGVAKPATTSLARVDFTDLHATLVEVAGHPAPDEITGRSFLAALTGRGLMPLVRIRSGTRQTVASRRCWKVGGRQSGCWIRCACSTWSVTRANNPTCRSSREPLPRDLTVFGAPRTNAWCIRDARRRNSGLASCSFACAT